MIGCAVTPEGLGFEFFPLSSWESCFWIPLLVLSICYHQLGAKVWRKSFRFLEQSTGICGFFKDAIMWWNINLYELLFSCLVVSRNAVFRFELKIKQGTLLALGHCSALCWTLRVLPCRITISVIWWCSLLLPHWISIRIILVRIFASSRPQIKANHNFSEDISKIWHSMRRFFPEMSNVTQ